MNNFIYLDLEANGLTPDTIWCVVTRENGETEVHLDQRSLRKALEGSVSVCGHNLIGYDLPVLERLWGISVAPERIVDTLVLSRLFDPSRQGGHSLRAWGETLGFPKGDHDDWSRLSEEMIDYCKQDVAVTEAVHQQLVKDMEDFAPECIELEHKVQFAVQQQERNGWVLDQQLANELCATFKEGMNAIEAELQEMFPPIVEERISEKTGKRLKDKVTVFNVGSRQQVAERLATKGAKWNEKTPSGKPVVDEKTLKENNHVPEAGKVLEYLTLQKRYAQVHSWLEAVKEDGRVHGRVISNGAVTGRMTHQSPNMAQVPASHSPYGHECRSCWTVPEGKKLVGFDASGLELRMLAHYMDDKEFTNVLLTEDIHTRNQMAAGLETRPQAKTFIYAFLYGAGDAKIGSVVGGSARDGADLKQRFLRNTPALESLRERVTRASQRGYLRGLDGRRLRVRSEHAALNTLLQAAGAIVMKKALVILDDYAQQWKLNYKFIGNIHDEVQSEVAADQAQKFGWLAVECLKAAGVEYNLRCPLDGEFKVGTTWAETH
jgi:DNA polymerase I-like protein with 3'-5' exonuclease and polymerase domains